MLEAVGNPVVMENGTSQYWYDGFDDGDKIGVLGYGK